MMTTLASFHTSPCTFTCRFTIPIFAYYRRPYWGLAITFGIGFLIGAWLNRDCDWHHHRIYYHGWRGGGWINRSRPRVHITNVYVNNRYDNVVVNRKVFNRNVNVNNINRYNYVHRNVSYNNIQANNERVNRMNHVRPVDRPARPPVDNRTLNRNIDTTNPRLDQYRGHEGAPRPARPSQPAQPPLDRSLNRHGRPLRDRLLRLQRGLLLRRQPLVQLLPLDLHHTSITRLKAISIRAQPVNAASRVDSR